MPECRERGVKAVGYLEKPRVILQQAANSETLANQQSIQDLIKQKMPRKV